MSLFYAAGEEFMRYLPSATLAGGAVSGSVALADNPTSSLLSTFAAPGPEGSRRITTMVHRAGMRIHAFILFAIPRLFLTSLNPAL